MVGMGEVVQQLEALSALAEDPNSLRNTHIGQLTHNTSFRGSNVLSCPLWVSTLECT